MGAIFSKLASAAGAVLGGKRWVLALVMGLCSWYYLKSRRSSSSQGARRDVDAPASGTRFERAADFVANEASVSGLSTEQQLQLYAYYKQGTKGDCTVPEPSGFDMAGHAKWTAWSALAGMPEAAAQDRYCAFVTSVFGAWDANAPAMEGFGKDRRKRPKKQYNRSVSTMARSESSSDSDDDVFDPPTSDAGVDQEAAHRALCRAAKEGDVARVKQLVPTLQPGTINRTDEAGTAPIHYAADAGHVEVIRALVEEGADIELKDGDGSTPLLFAALCDYPQVVRVLLQLGADASATDNDGGTAKEYASGESLRMLNALT